MSAVQESTEQSTMIEEDAFDLLHCFYGGVDVYVRQLAVQVALEQHSFTDEGRTILITKKHVEEAGELAVHALKELLKDKQLPPEAKRSLEGMSNCFQFKTDV